MKINIEKCKIFCSLNVENNFRIFWNLFDALVDARSGFVHNREQLLQAFCDGNLYLMSVDDIVLPAFCAVSEFAESESEEYHDEFDLTHICEMLWVREDIRRSGVATAFVKRLRIIEPDLRVEGSEPFWNRVFPKSP